MDSAFSRQAEELVHRLQSSRGLLEGVETSVMRRAFLKAPRSFFLPPASTDEFGDEIDPSILGPLRIGDHHHSAPDLYVTALLHLNISERTSFLNIGSGTGWLSCIVAIMQNWRGINHGVEVIPELAEFSVSKIERIASIEGVKNSVMVVNANFLDLDQEANIKYDAIYFSRNCPNEEILLKTRALLNPGGRMVVPYNGVFLCITQEGLREAITTVIFGNLKVHHNRGERFTIVHKHDLSEIDLKSADGDSPILIVDREAQSSRGKQMYESMEFADVEFVFPGDMPSEEDFLFSTPPSSYEEQSPLSFSGCKYFPSPSKFDGTAVASSAAASPTHVLPRGYKENRTPSLLGHRCVLAPASPFFAGLFCRGFAESEISPTTGRCVVTIRDCPPYLFQKMLEYIYVGSLHISPINMVYLMKVADVYGVQDLCAVCEKTLVEQCVTLNSACALLQVSHSLMATQLVETCVGVIARQCDTLLANGDMLALHQDLLKLILARDDVNAREIDVWNFVVRWTSHQVAHIATTRIASTTDTYHPSSQDVSSISAGAERGGGGPFDEEKKCTPTAQQLRSVAGQLLPLIRLSQMSAKEVIYDVGPYGVYDREDLETVLKIIECSGGAMEHMLSEEESDDEGSRRDPILVRMYPPPLFVGSPPHQTAEEALSELCTCNARATADEPLESSERISPSMATAHTASSSMAIAIAPRRTPSPSSLPHRARGEWDEVTSARHTGESATLEAESFTLSESPSPLSELPEHMLYASSRRCEDSMAIEAESDVCAATSSSHARVTCRLHRWLSKPRHGSHGVRPDLRTSSDKVKRPRTSI